MARRKAKRSGRSKKSIAILPLAGTAVGFGSGAVEGYNQTKDIKGVVNQSVYRMTGFSMTAGTWTPGAATGGMIVLGSVGISMIGRKLGLNKYIPMPKGFKLF